VISGLMASPSVLWPPNHSMVNVTLSYDINDICDAQTQIAVTSNQSTNSIGDGNTAKDWQIVNAHNVLLRSERAGNGSSDRVYTITLTVTDSGLKTTGAVMVTVPHDAGQ
jgi:hypothetical protein